MLPPPPELELPTAPEQPPPGISFELKSVEVTGATVYTPDQLKAAYASFLGKQVSVDELPQIEEAITAFYRRDGYILSRAVVDAQTIDPQAGVLHVKIYEGYIDTVRLDPLDYEVTPKGALIRSILQKIAHGCRSGQTPQGDKPCPLHRDVLERYLLLANDLPGVTASAVIQPSVEAEGGADLFVTVNEHPAEYSASLDNRGSAYVGPLTAHESAAFNDRLGFYERTELRAAQSIPMNELELVNGVEEIPISSDGLRLAFDFTHTRSRPGALLRPLNLATIGDAGGVTLAYPYLRTRSANLQLRLSLELRNSITTHGIADATAFYDRTRVATFGASYDLADQWLGVNLADFSIGQGIPLLGATPATTPTASHPGSSNHFTKLNGEVSRVQQVLPSINVLAAATGQYSFSKLLSAEQFGYGGDRYGHAYDASEVLGDRGVAAKTELQYTPDWAAGMMGWNDGVRSLQFYVVADVGRAWNDPGPSQESERRVARRRRALQHHGSFLGLSRGGEAADARGAGGAGGRQGRQGAALLLQRCGDVLMSRRHRLASLLASTSLGALLVSAPGAFANPQGGQVVSGGATIVQSSATPNRLVINQTTENAVLNWQSFNIGASEQVVFQQPNAGAIALNRVMGGDASTIAGALTANGQVWIVNPNGVFFTKSAVVNVAGLVATTSQISPANFMAGNYAFESGGNAAASVVNAGSVTVADAGLAAFVAPAVANSGVIAARLGKVALVSGSKFTVDLYGDNLVKLAVDDKTGATLAGAAVSNSGKIAADGGTVMLTASAAETIVDNAINVGGTIEARTASMQNGKIVLSGAGGQVALGGTLDASGKGAGETGGTVQVLGGVVNLAGTAKVDVSGDAGGGTALVGGNFHGAGPEPNATDTVVASGASIDADAVTSGKGGSVAVWASGTTIFDGSITARGGAKGGNGGYVETSGWAHLSVGDAARVDTRAPQGRTGTWLLDPQDITVASGADGSGGADAQVDGTISTTYAFATNPGLDVTVSTGAIVTGLGTSAVVLQAGRDITVNDAITGPSTSNNLTLQAGRNIALNASITLKGGSFSATANDSADANAGGGVGDPDRSSAAAGSFTMASGTTIDTSASSSAAIAISVGPSATNNDGSGNDFTPGSITLGALTTGSNGNLTVSGAATSIAQTADVLTIGGASAFSTNTSHATIALGSANKLGGTVTLSTTGSGANVSLTNAAAGGTTLGASSGGGNLAVTNSHGTFKVSGAVDSTGNGYIQLNSAGALSIGARSARRHRARSP